MPTRKPSLREFELETEVADLRRLIDRQATELRKSRQRAEVIRQAVYDATYTAAAALGKPGPIKAPARDRRKVRQEEIALAHLTDWQIGKVTDTFSPEIAQERIERLSKKIIKLTDIERADHPVREIHLALGGDMAEGVTIFPGQKWEINEGVLEQVFVSAKIVESFIRQMLATFNTVTVWCVTGNHGLIGRRGDYPREDNLDGFIYRVVRDRVLPVSNGRLAWNDPDRWYAIIPVGKYRVMLVHGDQVKSFGGQVPAFGIARKANGWASGVVPAFNDVMMGHFHQPLVVPLANGGRVFVSPSIESSNAYAQEFMAATGVPAQRLHFVDPDRGRLTSERLVYVE